MPAREPADVLSPVLAQEATSISNSETTTTRAADRSVGSLYCTINLVVSIRFRSLSGPLKPDSCLSISNLIVANTAAVTGYEK